MPGRNTTSIKIELISIMQQHKEYSDGSVYDGGIRDGRRNGRGTMKYHNGNIYSGGEYMCISGLFCIREINGLICHHALRAP